MFRMGLVAGTIAFVLGIMNSVKELRNAMS